MSNITFLFNIDNTFDGLIGPTHILSSDGTFLIPLFLGKPFDEDQEKEIQTNKYFGVYIKTKDFDFIDHNKIYILLQEPWGETLEYEHIKQIYNNVKKSYDLNGPGFICITRYHNFEKLDKYDVYDSLTVNKDIQ